MDDDDAHGTVQTDIKVRFVGARRSSSGASMLRALALDPPPAGTIALSGGARDFPAELETPVRALMRRVMQLAFDAHLLIVDGGTAWGVMKIAGETLAELARATPASVVPPLVGFVPAPLVAHPGTGSADRGSKVNLERHHQYFVLVEDALAWGQEITCMSRFVQYVAGRGPALALVVDGGPNTLREVALYLRHGHPVVVLEGSKRSADLIVQAVSTDSSLRLARLLDDSELLNSDDPVSVRAQALRNLLTISKSTNVSLFNVAAAPDEIVRHMASILACPSGRP